MGKIWSLNSLVLHPLLAAPLLRQFAAYLVSGRPSAAAAAYICGKLFNSSKVIQEYLDLGHMHLVSPNNESINFYLPHQAVFKPDSTTTKVRVVLNASNKSSSGYSLNDTLHTGPVLRSDLIRQILKRHFFKYVINADITKMFRQILVHSDHTRFQ